MSFSLLTPSKQSKAERKAKAKAKTATPTLDAKGKAHVRLSAKQDGKATVYTWALITAKGDVEQKAETTFAFKSNARRDARKVLKGRRDLLLLDLELKRTRKLFDIITREGKTGHAARIAKAKAKARKKAVTAKAEGKPEKKVEKKSAEKQAAA